MINFFDKKLANLHKKYKMIYMFRRIIQARRIEWFKKNFNIKTVVYQRNK